jgi:ferredoxin
MAKIRFSSRWVSRTVVVDPRPGSTTLLAVARLSGVPLLFNCETGDCGACLVRVVALSGGNAHGVPLTDNEELYLRASGRLPAGESGETDGAVRDRLACQYVVGPGHIHVRFETDLAAR